MATQDDLTQAVNDIEELIIDGEKATAKSRLQKFKRSQAIYILQHIQNPEAKPTAQVWLKAIQSIPPPVSKSSSTALGSPRNLSSPGSQPVRNPDASLGRSAPLGRSSSIGAGGSIAIGTNNGRGRTQEKPKRKAPPQPTKKTVSTGSTTTVVNETQRGPGCVIQFIWFWFVGWWATQIWVGLAWFFLLTIIGIPLSIFMINRVSSVIALRPPANKRHRVVTVGDDGSVSTRVIEPHQIPIIIRIFWFIVFGWWLVGMWMEIAYFFSLTLIGLPLGLWMFDRTASILTLKRQG